METPVDGKAALQSRSKLPGPASRSSEQQLDVSSQVVDVGGGKLSVARGFRDDKRTLKHGLGVQGKTRRGPCRPAAMQLHRSRDLMLNPFGVRGSARSVHVADLRVHQQFVRFYTSWFRVEPHGSAGGSTPALCVELWIPHPHQSQ